MPLLWAFYGFTASLFHASYMIANQYLKMPGWAVMVLMRAIIVVALLPMALTTKPIMDPWFYVAVLGTSLLAFNADSMLMGCIKDFGAGPVSRVFALTIPTSFIMWSVLHPSSLNPLIENPVSGTGAVTALILTTYFIFQLRACSISSSLLKRFIPVVVLLFAPIDIINKTAMDRAGDDVIIGAFYYVFIQSIGIICIVLLWTMIKHLALRMRGKTKSKKQQTFDVTLLQLDIRKQKWRKIFVGVSSVAFFFMAYLFFKNLAMKVTLNPAYITLLVGLSPFWIIVINRLTNFKDDSDIKSGIGLIFSALALVTFVNMAAAG
jgi:hypothetical protein